MTNEACEPPFGMTGVQKKLRQKKEKQIRRKKGDSERTSDWDFVFMMSVSPVHFTSYT